MKTLSAAFVAAAFSLLLSAPLWAQGQESPADEGEGITEGTPVPDPDAPTLRTVVDEAQRLVNDAMKGVVRSDNPRLAEIEQQLRLLQNPPKPSRPTRPTTRGSRPTPNAPAPSSPQSINGHIGDPGHGTTEHLVLEVWGVCRQLRALHGGAKESKNELLAIRNRLDRVDQALKKFDERLTTEQEERQSDDTTLVVLFLLLFGAGMFFIGITHTHQQGD
ncbi:MAG: hypothetical protein CEN89_27 [Candidatus Berkelbacteria bacterium Licking1014_7]|uniref:Uncharacterized protein n=1 Tax=Candidatus Berkelbacteria bacterium Licking1014_7 TaxID=2017147 RepID=A0A554LKU2_9BACT|nr:MAG: hypothetical protein CEN89_27 [Candidatus Berkelbacteria bacterium Licking1014_7]